MYCIVRSILDQPYPKVEKFIAQLQSKRELLTTEEFDLFTYLAKYGADAGRTPTLEIVQREQPAAALFLNDETPFTSFKSLKIHTKAVLADRSRKHAAMKMVDLAGQVGKDGFSTDVLEGLSEIRQEIARPPKVEDITFSAFPDIYQARKDTSLGPRTGIEMIDDVIGGMAAGSLNTIMAFAGHCKTTMAMNIAYLNSFMGGYNVCYVTLELPREQLQINLLSRHSYALQVGRNMYIPHERIRLGTLEPGEEEIMLNLLIPSLLASKGKLVILEQSDFHSLDIEDLYLKMEEIDDTVEGGIDLFIWDHIQMFKYALPKRFARMSELNVMNAYANQFMQWALDFRGRPTTQLLLAQTNRQGWLKAARNQGVYDLTALAEVNEVERASSRVISIFTTDEGKLAHEARVQLLKSRYGPPIPEPFSVFVDLAAYVFGGKLDNSDFVVREEDGNSVNRQYRSLLRDD